MNVNTVAPLYMAALVVIGLALAQLGDIVRPSKLVVERCAVSVYHGGNRVTFVGRGEVWE